MIGGENFSTCKPSINCSPPLVGVSQFLLRSIKHFGWLCNQLYPMRLKLKFNKMKIGDAEGTFQRKLILLRDDDRLTRPKA